MDAVGGAAAPIVVEPAIVVGEEHRIGVARHTGGQRDPAERRERSQGRVRGVNRRVGRHQEELALVADDGRRVAEVAHVERMMFPGEAAVAADPGHVHGRVHVPLAFVPENRHVGQLAVLLHAVQEPQAGVAHRGADERCRDMTCRPGSWGSPAGCSRSPLPAVRRRAHWAPRKHESRCGNHCPNHDADQGNTRHSHPS